MPISALKNLSLKYSRAMANEVFDLRIRGLLPAHDLGEKPGTSSRGTWMEGEVICIGFWPSFWIMNSPRWSRRPHCPSLPGARAGRSPRRHGLAFNDDLFVAVRLPMICRASSEYGRYSLCLYAFDDRDGLVASFSISGMAFPYLCTSSARGMVWGNFFRVLDVAAETLDSTGNASRMAVVMSRIHNLVFIFFKIRFFFFLNHL